MRVNEMRANEWTRWVLAGVVVGGAMLAGCGAPPMPTSSTQGVDNPCPAGQAYSYEFSRCVYVDPPDSGTGEGEPDCHPVTCQVYSDWARFGDGGAAAGWCSAACAAHCAGDVEQEAYGLEKAREGNMECVY